MPAALPASNQKKPRIILVDDEKHMLQLFEIYIREWFKEVDLVLLQNGDYAWNEFSRQEPDLLITDWYHPGLDGGELVQKLIEIHSQVPVLLISACDAEYVREFQDSGVKIVFLQKPFGSEQLWRLLNDLVGPCDFPARVPVFSR
jgi:two-component system nitrogen regulation response regulator GlnG